MVGLARDWLGRADTIPRLRRMATPRAPGVPALEGVRFGVEDDTGLEAELRRVRGAVPGLAVCEGTGPGLAVGEDDRAPADEPAHWTDRQLLESAGGDIHADALVGATVAEYRALARDGEGAPIILHVDLPADPDDALLYGAAVAGSLLCDGIGDAVRFGGPHEPERLLEMVLGVLQACRLRASRTEYIACPGCGRTLFDLESTTKRIKARTGHLPGVKIAVMGCIVNGPGEMADADFGYVGSTPGFVNLYVGKDIVERAVPQEVADDRLIGLLKSRGVWKEPAEA
jgi:hypothetical protein